MAFDVEAFIADCQDAVPEVDCVPIVSELVERAVAHRGWIEELVGASGGRGPRFLHRAPNLTIYTTVVQAGNEIDPHEHRLWAVAGLASGAERNVMYRRDGDVVVAERVLDLGEGDVAVMDADVIHSSFNPAVTAAVHVYGGDLMATPRLAWDGSGRPARALSVLAPGSADEANKWFAEQRRLDEVASA